MAKCKLIFRLLSVYFGFAALACLSACVLGDHRKPFSSLGKSIRRADDDRLIQTKLLGFIPLGTPRAEVCTFLTSNLKASANICLDDPPPKFITTDAASTISVGLWTWYAPFGVQFETVAWFYFNKEKKLDHLDVFTADASF